MADGDRKIKNNLRIRLILVLNILCLENSGDIISFHISWASCILLCVSSNDKLPYDCPRWSVLAQYLWKDYSVCRLEKCDADCVAVATPWDTAIKLGMHRN